MKGVRKNEVEGPFWKKGKRLAEFFQGHKKLLGTVLGAETVLNLGFKASPCGSTQHAVQHRAAAAYLFFEAREFWNFAEGGFLRLHLGSRFFQSRESACGSTPRSSCNLFFEAREFWNFAKGGFLRLHLGSRFFQSRESACGSTPRSSCILFFEVCELWNFAEEGFFRRQLGSRFLQRWEFW